MAKKLIHDDASDLGRLRCDNPRCRHVLEAPLPWSQNIIGYPCPRCGSNMLTRQDYETAEKLFRRVSWINRWFGWLGTEQPTPNAKYIDIKIGGKQP